MKPMRACLLAMALPFVVADARAAAAPQLEASAGIAGIARAGRWMPVDVRLVTSDTDIDGEIVATWGNAVVHHAVSVAAPSRTHIELYLRTSDPRDSVHLELRSKGRVVAALDTPVHLAASTDDVMVCVGEGASAAGNCTATIAADRLPRSARGLEAADTITWLGRPEGVSAAQHQALDVWRAYRDLLSADVLTRSPRVGPFAQESSARRDTLLFVAVVGLAYGVLLTAGASLPFLRGRTPTSAMYLTVMAVVILGTTAVVFAGSSGLSAAVHIRHATTIQQLGNGTSLVTMRGAIELPAFDRYRVTVNADDAAVVLDEYPRRASWFDESGRSVVSGTFALGSSVPFDLEAFVPFSPLAMERDGAVIRVTNTGGVTLRACRFPSGFAEREPLDLAPGTSVTAAPTASSGDLTDTPIVSCTLSGLPLTFREPDRRVEATGTVVLNAYLPDLPTNAAGGVR